MLMASSLTAQKHSKLRAETLLRIFPAFQISANSRSITEHTRSAVILRSYPLDINRFLGDDSADPIQKVIAICIIEKDLTPFDSTNDDVMERSGSIYSGFSWHDIIITL